MGRKRIPGLYQRSEGGTWHIDKIICKTRLCESTGTSDLEEAEKYLARRIDEIRNAKVYGIRPARTFQQAAAKYLLEKQHKRSIAADMWHFDELMPYIGHLPLDQIHIGSLQGYIASRKEKGWKTKSINLSLTVVRHLLNLAAGEWIDEHGLTWLHAAPKIKLFKVLDARPPYPLSFQEQRVLFPRLPEYLHDMALFDVNAGPREQEVCSLKWEYEVLIPELNTSVFIMPSDKVKNALPHVIILNSVAKSIIEKWRGIHPVYVFSYNGKRIYSMYGRAWKKARQQVNLPVTVHDLRHTFGCRLRAAGVSEHDIKDLLGHKSSSVTHHYSVAQIGSLIEAAEKLVTLGKDSPNLTVLRVKSRSSNSVASSRKIPESDVKIA